ncbi:phage virion morphogenesis protein [Synechococcales cyanobacterium C]|uniref:Phage virion morphogenesis protein n=1 Tax=Petrachloros mirabilis ULC683 TaxID=2781853 RepID=A0A8K1ZZ85_9CYAN|nr:phage virion morphogenesis protein [Petrachloros mirabilis]NCJ06671.1 phage virion morphogenesis protein [Petrachloros mirabilis ULC683]
MASITITLDADQAQAALDALQAANLNLSDAMDQIGEYMLLQTEERFKRQIDPEGNPWAPLSPEWLKYKERKNKILKILQMNGDLLRTIIYQSSPRSVEIGTNRIYGNVHQFGYQDSARGINIPARPYLGVSPEDEIEIAAILEDYLRATLP